MATAIYIANWWQLAGPGSYWQAFGSAAPLNHTWSLAIEEQFYLVWPIVALLVWRFARRPARALLTVAGAAIAASIVAQWILYQPGTDGGRAYLGTDTRAASILIGCAAAIALWARGHRVDPVVWHWLHLLAPVALVGIVVAWFVGGPGAWLYRGGFPLLALAAAVILASSAAPTPSRLNRALGWAPLVLIGQVSYGIYLWHWPVFALLGPEQLHARGLAAAGVPAGRHGRAGDDRPTSSSSGRTGSGEGRSTSASLGASRAASSASSRPCWRGRSSPR